MSALHKPVNKPLARIRQRLVTKLGGEMVAQEMPGQIEPLQYLGISQPG